MEEAGGMFEIWTKKGWTKSSEYFRKAGKAKADGV
jgi:hypothetical protein